MAGHGMIGSLQPFNANEDGWTSYEEIMEQFFIVNGITDDKRPAFLISCIGTEAYKTLRDLSHPVPPKDRTYEQLVELLRKQFTPQVSIFRERSVFYKAVQMSGENATTWYGRIKKLSVDCKFGDHLESVLLDKFITGLRPGLVMDRLCEESEKLTLKEAVDIAVNKECSLTSYSDDGEETKNAKSSRRQRKRQKIKEMMKK